MDAQTKEFLRPLLQKQAGEYLLDYYKEVELNRHFKESAEAYNETLRKYEILFGRIPVGMAYIPGYCTGNIPARKGSIARVLSA